MSGAPDIVTVGVGFGGAAVARRLEPLLPASAQVTVVNPNNSPPLTPLLSVTTAGLVELRHALVPS